MDYKIDLATADAGALHYWFFQGDLIFRVNGCDFSRIGVEEPVLDFAVCLVSIAAKLNDHNEDIFEVSESDEMISFCRDGPLVTITSNYQKGTAIVDYSELQSATKVFLGRMLNELGRQYPRMRQNPYIQQVVRDFGLALA